MKRDSLVLLTCLCLASCGVFLNKPTLPKQSTGEISSTHPDEWTMAVNRAEIIYFPVETISAESGEDSVAKIVRALKKAGTPFSIAWFGIELEKGDQVPRTEPVWSYSGSLREKCKIVMRDTIDSRQLFLGLPREMREKLQRGSALDGDERRIVPRGYRTPTSGLEDFAEKLATVRGLHERDIRNLYRAHVVAAQSAAEKIVTFMREHPGEKLLVFARRRELTGDCGLPAFVSQKLTVRQLTFDRERSRSVRPRLVRTDRAGKSLTRFQIVNRAPAPARNRGHAFLPRTNAGCVI